MTNRRVARTAFALTAGLGLAVSVVRPAGAAAPARFTTEYHNADSVPCGTFQDNYTDDG